MGRPDITRRRIIESQLPALPLDYFEQHVPLPLNWEDETSTVFLWFSDVFAEEAIAATERGWPVRRIDGNHLHMVVEPVQVATVLIDATTI